MSQAAASKAKSPPAASTKEKKKATPSKDDRYDETRTVLSDPRNPRTLGPPCHGQHDPAPAYKGSVTGSNGHAKWVGCAKCLLRLSYTPAYGATGLHRQAGPLPEDTKHQIEELGEKAPYNPLLKNQAVGLDGAERSLLTKLDHIRARKAATGYYAPPTPSTNVTSSPGTPTATERASPADAEELSQVPGSKSRRAADLPAEQVEYEDRSHRSWSPVSPPSGGGEARSV